jgi:hypothetical protein
LAPCAACSPVCLCRREDDTLGRLPHPQRGPRESPRFETRPSLGQERASEAGRGEGKGVGGPRDT